MMTNPLTMAERRRAFGLGATFSKGVANPEHDAKAQALHDDGAYGAAIELLWPSAIGGSADALNLAGTMYDEGQGVRENKARAAVLYALAAERGSGDAMFSLGYNYEFGDGVEIDGDKCIAFYRQAVEAGEVKAQVNLALKYENGQFVEQDLAEAARLFKLAADQGNMNGAAGYGIALCAGYDGAPDRAEGVKWLRRAADSDNMRAITRLTELALDEDDPTEGLSPSDGIRYLEQRAENEDGEACVFLAAFHHAGMHVERDPVKAYGWACLGLIAELEEAGDPTELYLNVLKTRDGLDDGQLYAGRRFVLEKGGLKAPLIMAHIYLRRLGADISVGEPDSDEHDLWIAVAMEERESTLRYVGFGLFSEVA